MSTALQDISLDLCDSISTALGNPLSVGGSDYPVYLTMPKIAPDNYIYIGGVIQTEDGTKDDFQYTGTVQIRVTTDNRHTAEKKLAQEIINAVRQTLKPTKPAVFAMTNFSLIVFKHESYTELVGQSEGGLRIDLIDIYSFLIT